MYGASACEVQFQTIKHLFLKILILLACTTVLTILYIIHYGVFEFSSLCIRPKLTDKLTQVKIKQIPNISSVFQNFPLDLYENAMNKNDTDEIHSILENLIFELSNFIVLEPYANINSNCSAPPLLPMEINCSKYPEGFIDPRNRTLPRVKIGILLQFGFDVDVLEIYLNELYDIVDLFFITEALNSHYNGGALKKPLIWEKIKDQSRFAKFMNKIVHFVIDEADVGVMKQEENEISKNPSAQFSMENLQERLRWAKFLEWNKARNFFGDDDILGFGDADEIPSRSTVFHFRSCQMKFPVLDIGIWFPFGNINFAFPSDFPVRGHPFTLGDPTFWEFWAAKEYFNLTQIHPSRNRGRSPGFALGGIHMTHSGYLPFQIVKRITQSEGGPLSIDNVKKIINKFKIGKLGIRELEIEWSAVPKQYIGKISNLSDISVSMEEIAVLPWFYDCDRGRYPMWEGNHDSRID